MASCQSAIRIPFRFDDPVHPTYWRLDVLLPRRSEVLGIGILPEDHRLQASPVLLAAGNPDNEMVPVTFLIAGTGRKINDPEGFVDRVRFIDSFEKPAGRLGAVGIRIYSVYHVLKPKPPEEPIEYSEPAIARRVSPLAVLPPSRVIGHHLNAHKRRKEQWS